MAVPAFQHSDMLGQRASAQTVFSEWPDMISEISLYTLPPGICDLSQSGRRLCPRRSVLEEASADAEPDPGTADEIAFDELWHGVDCRALVPLEFGSDMMSRSLIITAETAFFKSVPNAK